MLVSTLQGLHNSSINVFIRSIKYSPELFMRGVIVYPFGLLVTGLYIIQRETEPLWEITASKRRMVSHTHYSTASAHQAGLFPTLFSDQLQSQRPQ